MITTLLGSCVAACLYDPAAGVGGMNHFLLPDGGSGGLDGARLGVNAMELLINRLIRAGAEKPRFRAKLFAGSRIIAASKDVGRRNADFVLRFLRDERIAVEALSLGGHDARRVEFWPGSGRARQMFIADPTVMSAVAAPPADAANAGGSDLELFRRHHRSVRPRVCRARRAAVRFRGAAGSAGVVDGLTEPQRQHPSCAACRFRCRAPAPPGGLQTGAAIRIGVWWRSVRVFALEPGDVT
jgi:chemotaxis protein CheD